MGQPLPNAPPPPFGLPPADACVGAHCGPKPQILGLTVPDRETGKVEYSTGWIEGAAILTSVVVVVIVTSINDYNKALQFAELNKTTAAKEVRRVTQGTETYSGTCPDGALGIPLSLSLTFWDR